MWSFFICPYGEIGKHNKFKPCMIKVRILLGIHIYRCISIG